MKQYPVVIKDPIDIRSFIGKDASLQFVIPVHLNDDLISDFISVYWLSADSEKWGTHNTSPTPDILVAHLSQPNGTYEVSNESVFGNAYPKLGGASRKYVRGDINGDGVDDFAFAMNWEDGRNADEAWTNEARPALLLSNGRGSYDVQQLGEYDWGHSVELIDNAIGTKDAVFAGYTLGQSQQAFRYKDGAFVNVSSEYPDFSTSPTMKWANAVRSIQSSESTTEAQFIVGAAADWDRNAESYSVLKEGLELFQRQGAKWELVDTYWFEVEFTAKMISWQETVGTTSVFRFGDKQYFGGSIQEIKTLSDSSDENKAIIVAKVSASKHRYDETLSSDKLYNEDDADPVTIYLFFEKNGSQMRLIDSPIIDEYINSNVNFFDYYDINKDGHGDLISYAFTEPWRKTQHLAGGKPIIYLSDSEGSLNLINLDSLPTHSTFSSVSPSLQSIIHDVDEDGFNDLVLFGTSTLGGSGDIEIYYLDSNISMESNFSVVRDENTSHVFPMRLNQVQAFGFSPDENHLIIKSDGVNTMVDASLLLFFSDSTVTTGHLKNLMPTTPIFSTIVNGQVQYVLPDLFTGPASLNLDYQLIDDTPNAVMTGSDKNDFIKLSNTTSLGKAVDAGAGDDVIDGGVGSAFVTGGAGSNTFFLDGRADGVSWSTITDFKLDVDKATIWGWKQGVSKVVRIDMDGGAPRYEGVTFHFENLLPSNATDGQTNGSWNSLTFSGKTLADFGASSLEQLNAQITASSNPTFMTGVSEDAFGAHGYLYVA